MFLIHVFDLNRSCRLERFSQKISNTLANKNSKKDTLRSRLHVVKGMRRALRIVLGE